MVSSCYWPKNVENDLKNSAFIKMKVYKTIRDLIIKDEKINVELGNSSIQ